MLLLESGRLRSVRQMVVMFDSRPWSCVGTLAGRWCFVVHYSSSGSSHSAHGLCSAETGHRYMERLDASTEVFHWGPHLREKCFLHVGHS